MSDATTKQMLHVSKLVSKKLRNEFFANETQIRDNFKKVAKNACDMLVVVKQGKHKVPRINGAFQFSTNSMNKPNLSVDFCASLFL